MSQLVKTFIEAGRIDIRDRLRNQPYIVTPSREARISLVANYTAAIAVNFTDWVGKTIPWVRHEAARFALTENLRCEMVNDHATMLENFAGQCHATPSQVSYYNVCKSVQSIRELFRTPPYTGLQGIALIALLENTSIDFIPILGKVAKELGCPDEQQEYIRVHGEADVAHSSQLIEALEAEVTMAYGDWVPTILGQVQYNVSFLFEEVFGQLND